MESRKIALIKLFAGKQWRHRHRVETYGHKVGERERCMERVTWKLILPYVKQIANGNLPYDSGNTNNYNNLEG